MLEQQEEKIMASNESCFDAAMDLGSLQRETTPARSSFTWKHVFIRRHSHFLLWTGAVYTGTCLFAEKFGLSPTAILTTAVCTKNMLSFGQLQLCIMYVQAFMGLEYIRQLGMDLEGKCPSIMSHFERQQTAATSSNKQQQQHGL
jgi:hypothetical protein